MTKGEAICQEFCEEIWVGTTPKFPEKRLNKQKKPVLRRSAPIGQKSFFIRKSS